MWERLRQADIVLAKQQLRQRVDETLLRHAEELKQLDHDAAELDALKRLLDEFSRKFKGGAGDSLTEPAAPGEDQTVAPPTEDPGAAEPPPAASKTAEAEPAAAAEPEAAAEIEDEAEPAPAIDEEESATVEEKKSAIAAAAKEAPVLPNAKTADKPSAKSRSEARERDRDRDKDRDRPRTNFDAFTRAMAKQDRW